MKSIRFRTRKFCALLEHTDHGMFAPGTQVVLQQFRIRGARLGRRQSFGKAVSANFCGERIFAPLKMDQTVLYERGKNEISNRAYGHHEGGAAWKQTDQSSTSATLGDGGIYSSLEDLGEVG